MNLAIPMYDRLAIAASGLEPDAEQFYERCEGITSMTTQSALNMVVERLWMDLKPEGMELQDVLDYIVLKAATRLAMIELEEGK